MSLSSSLQKQCKSGLDGLIMNGLYQISGFGFKYYSFRNENHTEFNISHNQTYNIPKSVCPCLKMTIHLIHFREELSHNRTAGNNLKKQNNATWWRVWDKIRILNRSRIRSRILELEVGLGLFDIFYFLSTIG